MLATVVAAICLYAPSIYAQDTREGLLSRMEELKAKVQEANRVVKESKKEQHQLAGKIKELKEKGADQELKVLQKRTGELHNTAWKKTQEARKIKKEIEEVQNRLKPIDKKSEIEAAVAKVKALKPKKARKVLIYSRTTGFRHGVIPFAVAVFKAMGEKSGAYSSVLSEDPKVFDGDLDQFDGIILLNCSGRPIDRNHTKKFEQYLAKGKGLVGIHAATDSHKWGWDFYPQIIGAIFVNHPWTHDSRVTLYNEEPDHPICKSIKTGFQIQDEIYQFKEDKNYSRGRLRVLLSLDLTGPKMIRGGMKRKDNDYAVAWIHEYKGSRIFYSSLGHNEPVYLNESVLQHYINGIQYALGDLKADARPSAEVGNAKAGPLPEKQKKD